MSEMNDDPMKALWRSQTTEVPTMPISYWSHRAEELEKSLKFRSVLEQAACLLCLVLCAVIIGFEDQLWQKLGAAMLMMGTLYAWFQWRRRTSNNAARSFSSASAGLAFYRTELERRRDIHRTAWRWYALPIIVPGSAFVLLGMLHGHGKPNEPWIVFGLMLGAIVLSFAYECHQVAKFQREIDALATLEAGRNSDGVS